MQLKALSGHLILRLQTRLSPPRAARWAGGEGSEREPGAGEGQAPRMLLCGTGAFRKANSVSKCGLWITWSHEDVQASQGRLWRHLSTFQTPRLLGGKPSSWTTQMLLCQCGLPMLLPCLPGSFLTIPGTEASSLNSAPGHPPPPPFPCDIPMGFCDSSVSITSTSG